LDQALWDCLVCGIHHQGTQKRLLSEAELTLNKATEIARSVEAAETQASQLSEISNAPVTIVKPVSGYKSQNQQKWSLYTLWGEQSPG